MYIFTFALTSYDYAQEATPTASEMLSEGINQALSVFFRAFLSILFHPLIFGLILLIVGLKVLVFVVRRKRRRRKLEESQQSNFSGGFSGEQGNSSTFNIKTDLKYELNPSFLTVREASFFRVLLPIANNYGLYVFAKPRIADFVDTTVDDRNSAQFWRCFNEISRKHIDFLICDDYFKPLAGFEVDDASHKRPDRIARDAIVNAIYKSFDFKVFRVWEYSSASVEEMIAEVADYAPEDMY